MSDCPACGHRLTQIESQTSAGLCFDCGVTAWGVWHCLLCGMPQVVYKPHGGFVSHRCEFCGWDEAETVLERP